VESKDTLVTKAKDFGENVSGSYIPPRAKTLEQLLRYTTVEHLLADHGALHSVCSTDTVEVTLQCFRDNGIQSVPVYSSDDKSKFLGLVDTADIMEYFFSLSREQLDTHFFQTPVGDLIEISKFNPTPMVSVGTSLMQVLQILEKGETHRVGVLDPNSGTLYSVISQMLLTEFIGRNISLLEQDIRNRPASEFMKTIVQVENIPFDTKTASAFEYLFKRNISAAAIVNEAGIVVDTLSTSDIVGFLYDRFKNIDESVMKFLYATRRTKALKPPIVCGLTDTLEYAILKLASTHVHRLWVVISDSNQYLGLVNLTNVLHALAFAYSEMSD